MDIEYKGGNCIVITTKKGSIVIDPRLSTIGLKDISTKGSVAIATQQNLMLEGEVLTIDRAGEYEVGDASVVGVPTMRMIDHEGPKQATLYRIVVGGVSFAIVGHTAVPLTEDQLELLGVVDVAIVPVGGNGYTLDAHQAVGVVRQLDPRAVIPTHYADQGTKYEVAQMDLEPFIKELAAPGHDITAKWKIKNGIMPEQLSVIQIERSA